MCCLFLPCMSAPVLLQYCCSGNSIRLYSLMCNAAICSSLICSIFPSAMLNLSPTLLHWVPAVETLVCTATLPPADLPLMAACYWGIGACSCSADGVNVVHVFCRTFSSCYSQGCSCCGLPRRSTRGPCWVAWFLTTLKLFRKSGICSPARSALCSFAWHLCG